VVGGASASNAGGCGVCGAGGVSLIAKAISWTMPRRQ
jgi:hypothetical protein